MDCSSTWHGSWPSDKQGKQAVQRVFLDGGRGGIRTHGTLAGTPVFKTGALNHSATLPKTIDQMLHARQAGIAGTLAHCTVPVYGAALHVVNGADCLGSQLPLSGSAAPAAGLTVAPSTSCGRPAGQVTMVSPARHCSKYKALADAVRHRRGLMVPHAHRRRVKRARRQINIMPAQTRSGSSTAPRGLRPSGREIRPRRYLDVA
jgi:hypothetical protein